MAHPSHECGDAYDLVEVEPIDQTGQIVIKPAEDGQTYDLGEVVEEPPRKDLVELSKPARWCFACGCEITLVETGVCPRCTKKFDPANPATFSQEPPKELGNWWLQPPRMAGYLLLPLYLAGRLVINSAAETVGMGLQGNHGGSLAGNAAAAVVAALGALCLIPWLTICVLLTLIGISEYFAPKLTVTLGLGAAFGILFSFGQHPSLLFIGLGAGAIAGFIYIWKAI